MAAMSSRKDALMCLIGDEDTVTGFLLAGMPVLVGLLCSLIGLFLGLF
jgi:hypothetical protein